MNHKRIRSYLLVFGLTLLCLNAFSQAKIGLRGGINLSNVAIDFEDSNEENETKIRLGFNLGLTTEVELNDKLSFNPGIVFTSKGFSVDDLEGDDYDRIIINYLEIPLDFEVSFSDQFSAQVGPYVAFGVGGKNKFKFSGEEDEIDIEFKSGEVNASESFSSDAGFIERLDYGLNIGLNYKVNSVAKIGIGYGLGLNNLVLEVIDDIDDGFDDSQSSDDKVFNRVISLNFTYLINK